MFHLHACTALPGSVYPVAGAVAAGTVMRTVKECTKETVDAHGLVLCKTFNSAVDFVRDTVTVKVDPTSFTFTASGVPAVIIAAGLGAAIFLIGGGIFYRYRVRILQFFIV